MTEARANKVVQVTAKTSILSVNTKNIPDSLKEHPHWVPWKLGKPMPNGKRPKIPCETNGRYGDSTNLALAVSFDEVVAAYERRGFAGIGVVVSGENDFVGIDLDNICRKRGLSSLFTHYSNRLRTHSCQKCYPCLQYKVLPICPVWTLLRLLISPRQLIILNTKFKY